MVRLYLPNVKMLRICSRRELEKAPSFIYASIVMLQQRPCLWVSHQHMDQVSTLLMPREQVS